jgi:hypothetical protein
MQTTRSHSNGFVDAGELIKTLRGLMDMKCAVREAVWIIKLLQILVGYEGSVLSETGD